MLTLIKKDSCYFIPLQVLDNAAYITVHQAFTEINRSKTERLISASY